ncbi:MAG: helix-turn-helix domain-containing protein [Oscillospiraceae bacterium]|nr:helix-turn-helix domain-containing protein [Oscillospiraceae bacterium]
MNRNKTGELLRQLRTQRGLTQKQLAARLHVSDKAVSKWECGSGCPDVSLLAALAEVFETDMQILLTGETVRNERENGNMKKLRFYVCGSCGNLVTATAGASVTCCGSRLSPAEPRRAEPEEQLHIEDIGGEWYVTADHPMTKEHFISFAAYVTDSSVMMFRQYPEWDFQFTMPAYRSGRLFWYCSRCGLLWQDVCPARR